MKERIYLVYCILYHIIMIHSKCQVKVLKGNMKGSNRNGSSSGSVGILSVDRWGNII
jgi:hypothetical protein